MNTFPSEGTILMLATELNTEPAFLEKDWHVSNVIKALSSFTHDLFEPIFCGGTSLLKGYGIIHRFSEDVDFRLLSLGEGTISRRHRRTCRDDLLQHLAQVPELSFDRDNLISRDSSPVF